MANRSVSLEGMIWAYGAPNAPASPVQGTTYAKSNIAEAEVNNGQPYNEPGDSAKYNEILMRLTTLMDLVEQYGILPWCPTIDYPMGAESTGSDGNIYISQINPNLNNDPVASSGYWIDKRRVATESYAGLIPIATQSTVNTGTNDTHAITSLKLSTRLAALLVNTALTGNPTCPTQTAGDNSTKIANTAYVKTAADSAVLNGIVMGAWASFASNFIPPWTGTAYIASLTRNSVNIGYAYKISGTRPISGTAVSSTILACPAYALPSSTKTLKAGCKMETSSLYTSSDVYRDVTFNSTTGAFQIVGSRDPAGNYAYSFNFEGIIWA